SDL
ncbi:hypothetical protein D047_2319B, partial [Vibrio parahaemolyticus VPTS-2010_2]